LGCFRVEPRAEILHQKKQSVPLSPPINRFDLHTPWVEIIGSKVGRKPVFLPRIFLFLSSVSSHSLSVRRPNNHCHHRQLFSHHLHHRKPKRPPSCHSNRRSSPPADFLLLFLFCRSHRWHHAILHHRQNHRRSAFPPSFSSSLLVNRDVNYNSHPTIYTWIVGRAVPGLVQTSKSGPARP